MALEIINFQFSIWLLASILMILSVISIKLIFCKSLLETVIINSIFSLLISLSYLLMDAPDVAMTEVALGSCLSTCVFLSFLSRLPLFQKFDGKYETKPTRLISSSLVCAIFIIVFTFLGIELPEYGYDNSPLHTNITKYYIEHTKEDIGVPSFVAAILASYRGYDTLGETIVVLIAGISVLLLFSKKVKHA